MKQLECNNGRKRILAWISMMAVFLGGLLGSLPGMVSGNGTLAYGAEGGYGTESGYRAESGYGPDFSYRSPESYGPAFAGMTPPADELRGVWISYLTWNTLPKEKAAFEKAVDQMFDNCRLWGLNAVFVHVRSHGDAMYPSSVYPWSKFASGTQGVSPGYDPLAYMIQAAHARGLKFHAWINPYRVTGYLMPWEETATGSPARRWLEDQDGSNDRFVLKHDGAYYYNPSVEAVKQMVVDGVMEIVRGYEVDGIHFDDYFYPSLNDEQEGRWFDKPEYLASGSKENIVQWRRNQVSDLVSRVYRAIKAEKPQTTFGISPQGYVEHLRSDQNLFVDIDRWVSEDGYVDYIMPQLYWGFETKTAAGTPAPYAFDQNLRTWIDLKKRGNATLYLGLGLYRAGTNVTDHNEVSEWLRYDDIISRQVRAGRNSGMVKGFCLYSYDSFLQPEAQKEVENLLKLTQ